MKGKGILYFPVKGKTQVKEMDQWVDKDGILHEFLEHELNSKGDFKRDNNGEKIPVMWDDPEFRKRVQRKYKFRIQKNYGRAHLQLPKMQELVNYLAECPHCEGVNSYNGRDYSDYPKRFYMSDPEADRRKKEKAMSTRMDALSHSAVIKEKSARLFAAIVGIRFRDGNNELKSDYLLLTEVRDYSEKYSEEYLEFMADENFEVKAVVSYAIAVNEIYREGDTYTFEKMPLGHKQESVVSMLSQRNNQQLYEEIKKKINYDKYAIDVQTEETIRRQLEVARVDIETLQSEANTKQEEVDKVTTDYKKAHNQYLFEKNKHNGVISKLSDAKEEIETLKAKLGAIKSNKTPVKAEA